MAIQADQIKILESERLTDTDDGGGRATGRIVESGDVNAVFPPIDRIDQAFGEFSARKLFAGPQTASTEVYYGVHSAIIQDAMDKNINLLMCDTKSDSDNLRDLKDYVESYQVKGARTLAQLWGEHLQHQQVVVMYQPEEEKIPDPSDVLFLKDGSFEQPIRIMRVTHDIRDVGYFTNNGMTTVRVRRLNLELFNSLERDFPGNEPNVNHSRKGTEIFETRASSGVKYFGVKRLAKAVASGGSIANVGDLFMPLAPASKRTDILADQSPFAAQSVREFIAPTAENMNITFTLQEGKYYAYLPWLPGDGSIATVAGVTLKDRGDGHYIKQSGSGYDQLIVNVATRRAELTRTEGLSKPSSVSVAFSGRPAALFGTQTRSVGIVIDTVNQRNSYIFDLDVVMPRPESIVIRYRVLGKNYTIRCRGDGVLVGDGSGRIDAVTGTLQVTIPNLPDIGSTIMVSFGSTQDVNLRTVNNQPIVTQAKYHQVLQQPGEPGSFLVRWQNKNQVTSNTTAIDKGGRLIVGELDVGYVVYENDDGVAEIVLQPTSYFPDPDSNIIVDYAKTTTTGESFIFDTSSNSLVATLAYPAKPGSVQCTIPLTQNHDTLVNDVVTKNVTIVNRVRFSDDGEESIRRGGDKAGIYGSVGYESGMVTISPAKGYLSNRYRRYKHSHFWGGSCWRTEHTTEENTEGFVSGMVTIHYQRTDIKSSEHTETFKVPGVEINLAEYSSQVIVPGSVRIKNGSDVIIDHKGALIRNPHPSTGAGTQIGTIDYQAGTAILTGWTDDGFTIITLANASALAAQDTFMFLTNSAPLARDGLLITAVSIDGQRLSGRVESNGDLSGDFIGQVDFASGLVMLTAPNKDPLTSEQDPFLPLSSQSIMYSCVIEIMTPLDKAVIKIDPIRLPPDGRVPIYRPGDLLLLSHTATKSVGTPTAGQVVSVDRTYLAACDVVDSKGKPLKQAMRSIDLKAGTVTFSAPLSFVDEQGKQLSPPLVVKHRIEHMSPIADVQLNGDLKLLTAAYHDYPAQGTVVCSCPIHGDRWARAHTHFTQKNWDSGNPTWSDDRIGPDTAAKYDTINYPFELTNQGSVNERWALVFTGQTTFEVVGESLGVIATGNTNTDCAPINPNTKTPYFLIRADGWGSGWAVNNVVRFNTDAAISPIWLIRVTQPGKLEIERDEFVYQIRGDVV